MSLNKTFSSFLLLFLWPHLKKALSKPPPSLSLFLVLAANKSELFTSPFYIKIVIFFFDYRDLLLAMSVLYNKQFVCFLQQWEIYKPVFLKFVFRFGYHIRSLFSDVFFLAYYDLLWEPSHWCLMILPQICPYLTSQRIVW